MPISFATILGGTITVIGTSTNLVVSGLMEQAGMKPIGMFEITRVGVPVAIVGVGVLVLFAQRLLPDRRGAKSTSTRSTARRWRPAASVVSRASSWRRSTGAGR